MRLLISQRAADDLAHLYAWMFAERGESAAEEFKGGAEEAFELLRDHPQAGPHPAWATRHEALRFWAAAHPV